MMKSPCFIQPFVCFRSISSSLIYEEVFAQNGRHPPPGLHNIKFCSPTDVSCAAQKNKRCTLYSYKTISSYTTMPKMVFPKWPYDCIIFPTLTQVSIRKISYIYMFCISIARLLRWICQLHLKPNQDSYLAPSYIFRPIFPSTPSNLAEFKEIPNKKSTHAWLNYHTQVL